MNSEKVKEIKKALEDNKTYHFPYIDRYKCKFVSYSDILTLINELESDNGRMKQSNENISFVTEQVIKQNTELKDRIAELENENEKLDKENFVLYRDRFTKKELDNISACRVTKATNQLKDRIAELENGIAQSMLGCEFLPECVDKKLEQFATRLKEKTVLTPGGWCVSIEDIDETLKEFLK